MMDDGSRGPMRGPRGPGDDGPSRLWAGDKFQIMGAAGRVPAALLLLNSTGLRRNRRQISRPACWTHR